MAVRWLRARSHSAPIHLIIQQCFGVRERSDNFCRSLYVCLCIDNKRFILCNIKYTLVPRRMWSAEAFFFAHLSRMLGKLASVKIAALHAYRISQQNRFALARERVLPTKIVSNNEQSVGTTRICNMVFLHICGICISYCLIGFVCYGCVSGGDCRWYCITIS